ncbi:MAG: hypothetical protein JJ975_14070 [Bacteroidia bacterium]|nr:hypothetical protein [Bacteroidia bacterium]
MKKLYSGLFVWAIFGTLCPTQAHGPGHKHDGTHASFNQEGPNNHHVTMPNAMAKASL